MNQFQFTTLFAQKLESRKGTVSFDYILGVVVSVIVVVIVAILALPYLIFLVPLALIVNYRIAQSKKPKNEGFFIEMNYNFDIYYGYYDARGIRNIQYLIDEYTYWYYEDGMTMSGTKYVLIIMLKSKTEEVFLKEEVILMYPPEGWGYELQKVPDGPSVLRVNSLLQLVGVLNQVGVAETN